MPENRTTITSTDGRSVTLPARFAAHLSQTAVDTLISDAHSRHPVAVAVTRIMHIETVPA